MNFRFRNPTAPPAILPAHSEETGVETRRMTVCLVNEGSYPHYKGGVSTWCDMLVRGLPEIDFVIVSLVADPSAKPVFELPENVTRLITVPLWGTGEVLELQRDLSLAQVVRSKFNAPRKAIETQFVPLFGDFLDAIWTDEATPLQLVEILRALAVYFQFYDYDMTMRSQAVWDVFRAHSVSGYRQGVGTLTPPQPVSLLEVTNMMQIVYRWLTVLAVPIPQVDIVHAAAAGLCSIFGIVASRSPRTAFLLTEHGIYLRERLLALSRSKETHFERAFQARFAQRITEASYASADKIAPGSNYNHRWEIHNGAAPEIIQTIYNGPDPQQFAPSTHHKPADAPPTIVWLGRIDPLKDLETLIRAAAIVCDKRPDARFILYGKPPKGNEWYYQKCLDLRDRLKLQDNVIFAGFAASAAAAYNEGDFVLLSSISEGFPYSVVEAMMCERTVVGTDVGGVSEALEGCGLVVEPRNPADMARACLKLIQDPEKTRELGRQAREKALSQFSLQQCNSGYLATYQRLLTDIRYRHPELDFVYETAPERGEVATR
ncbi:MAG: GT4 family glycosyltransferase PelF [Anaerolineae bacterium]